MNKKALDIAVAEAARFLCAAKELQGNVKVEKWGMGGREIEVLPSGRLSAYVKRASMDLTRALADMRKPSR